MNDAQDTAVLSGPVCPFWHPPLIRGELERMLGRALFDEIMAELDALERNTDCSVS